MEEIAIRHAEPGDAEALHALYQLPKAIAGTLQLPYPSLALWQKRLQEAPANLHVLAAELDGKLVGSLGLKLESHLARRRHVAWIGMAVHDHFHNQGVGSALLKAAIDLAENWLQLTRLELTVFADNEAAIHLYKKFGFVEEGILKAYAMRNGRLCDALAMAKIRSLQF